MKKILLISSALILLVGAYVVSKSDPTPTPANVSGSQQEERAPAELGISISPEIILQGDPALIQVEGLGTSTVKSITYNGRKLGVFTYDSKPSALVGIDLKAKTGAYPVLLTLSDGRVVKKDLVVGAREIVKAPLGIPDKLGGNTPTSEQNLINTLIQESAIIAKVPTTDKKLWDGLFRFPLESITITDVYGYSRQTVGTTISHKGTDFRASIGTPVYAMNSGVVAYTDYLRNYGNTVIVDHGLGLQTIYMHLSEVNVARGDKVQQGQLIARSGDTGYVLGPHLHISVKINGVSIDPMKFMTLLGKE